MALYLLREIDQVVFQGSNLSICYNRWTEETARYQGENSRCVYQEQVDLMSHQGYQYTSFPVTLSLPVSRSQLEMVEIKLVRLFEERP